MVVSTTVFSDAYARPPFLAGQPNPGPAAGATGTFLRSPPQTAILGGLTASAQICEQLAADINRTHRDYCQNSPKNGAPTCAKALKLTLPAQRAASGVFTANPGVAPRSGTLRGHCCESRNARLTTTIVYAGQRGVIFLESESRDFQASRISTHICRGDALPLGAYLRSPGSDTRCPTNPWEEIHQGFQIWSKAGWHWDSCPAADGNPRGDRSQCAGATRLALFGYVAHLWARGLRPRFPTHTASWFERPICALMPYARYGFGFQATYPYLRRRTKF